MWDIAWFDFCFIRVFTGNWGSASRLIIDTMIWKKNLLWFLYLWKGNMPPGSYFSIFLLTDVCSNKTHMVYSVPIYLPALISTYKFQPLHTTYSTFLPYYIFLSFSAWNMLFHARNSKSHSIILRNFLFKLLLHRLWHLIRGKMIYRIFSCITFELKTHLPVRRTLRPYKFHISLFKFQVLIPLGIVIGSDQL